MTLKEFSIEFDLLYNNISSNQAPGLNEYEKSVFLTQAQEAVILDLYKGAAGDSFETTKEVTRYLNSLVSTYQEEQLGDSISILNKIESEITLPDDLMFIIYQSAVVNNRDVLVVPINHDMLFKALNNPFKGPNNRILSVSEQGKILLYSNDIIEKYHLKYLSNPYPIILPSLEDDTVSCCVELDLTIRNKQESKELTLPESLHNQILIRAVQIAKTVWAS